MSNDNIKDFFISYAQEDWEAAKWIAQCLEEAGYSITLPSRDFQPGHNFILEMEAATQAKRTIAILSPHYRNSRFVKPEWAEAFRLDPTGIMGQLLPVRIQRCDFPGFLGQLIYIDLVDQDENRRKKTLLSGVQQVPRKLKPATFPVQLTAPSTSVQPTNARIPSASENQSPASPRFGASFPATWNVSRRHAPYFTGRDDQIEQIFQRFLHRDEAQVPPPQALVGLGGLGKTQTAAEYAYRYRQEYQAVLWARADTEENLKSDFQTLVRLLKLDEQGNPAETMQKWFTGHDGWLLILDNADDLNFIASFFPQSPRGHVLVTTRAMASGNVAQSFLLEPLNFEEGALCILRRSGTIQWHQQLADTTMLNVSAAANIAALMDGLPLALEQAGAYIEDTGSSVNRYLKMYEEYRAQIIKDQYGALPNYPLAVAAAWKFSKDIVKQEQPATYEFLQLCAFLDPEAIPEEIFIHGAPALGSVLASVVSTPVSIDGATRVLRRYSLLNREVKGTDDISRFSIHRIIQEILRDEMDEASRQHWAERTIRALALALPFVDRLVMQVQVRHCLPLIAEWNMTFLEADQLRQFIEKKP